MTKIRWALSGLAFALLAMLAGAYALALRDALPPIEPPTAGSFDRTLVKRGDGLARIGNCIGCHTAADGKSLAGGRKLLTPFGTIFSTNITPSRETGIGTWSRQAFARAMREGVARDGHHLYPAFPYDHFTRASDGELEALYAFLMTRPAMEARAPDNRLVWPFGNRWLVAGWNLLYLRDGPAGDSDRGRVLAEGLAHCGGCHTPRNRLGAEDRRRAYDGGWSEGWYAPPLNGYSPAPDKWTADELFAYLRTGLSLKHSAAAGPMAEVTRELALAPEDEVRALATYFAGLMGKAPGSAVADERAIADKQRPEGAALFAGACAACHEAGAPMMQQGRPSLMFSTTLRMQRPHNALQVIEQGLRPPAGRPGPAMPSFADNLTDRQLAQIAAYLRARYTDFPPWRNLEQAVSEVRNREEQGERQ